MPGRVLFKEDFFERVVDVQWKKVGAIFVAGDVCCFNWYIKAQMKGGQPQVEFHGLGPMEFTDGGSTDGAAYGAVGEDKKNKIKGRPTFCLGGGHGEGEGDSAVSITQVLMSTDGQSWSEVYNEASSDDAPSVSGGAWNGKQFNLGELTSPDGHGWSRGGGGGRDDGGGTNEKGEYHSAGEFGADYLVYAGGVWCKAQGQSMEVGFDSEDGIQWQYAGTTSKYDVTCLCGGPLEDQPDKGK